MSNLTRKGERIFFLSPQSGTLPLGYTGIAVVPLIAKRSLAMQKQQLEEDRSTLAVSAMKQKRVLLTWYRWRQRVGLPYLFLAPFLLLFLLFFILPLGYALGISLFADRLVGGTVFVGSQNYLQALQDSSFWEGIRRMLLFMVVQVPVMLCLALIFALILDSGVAKLRTLFWLGFFLPYAIPSVVSALLWGYLYSPR